MQKVRGGFRGNRAGFDTQALLARSKSLGNYVDIAWKKAGRELVRKQKQRLISRKARCVNIGSEKGL